MAGLKEMRRLFYLFTPLSLLRVSILDFVTLSPTPRSPASDNPSPGQPYGLHKREGLKYRIFPFPLLRGEGAGVRGILRNISYLIFIASVFLAACSQSISATPTVAPTMGARPAAANAVPPTTIPPTAAPG